MTCRRLFIHFQFLTLPLRLFHQYNLGWKLAVCTSCWMLPTVWLRVSHRRSSLTSFSPRNSGVVPTRLFIKRTGRLVPFTLRSYVFVTVCIKINSLKHPVCTDGQSRGGGRKGGLEEESEQELNGKPAHGDWDPENRSPSPHSPVERLSGMILNQNKLQLTTFSHSFRIWSAEGVLPHSPQWDNENIYLILEWCSGGDLSRFIRSRRILPERVARRFLQQIGKE